MEFYQFKDLPDARRFYGLYTTNANPGLKVSCCGQNRGEKGKPNVVFHTPDYSAPRYKNGSPCNLLLGLEIVGLAQDFCSSFSSTALVFLGSDCLGDKHVSTHRHLHLTMDPQAVRYIMIAQHHSLQEQVKLPEILSKLAVHHSIGTPHDKKANPDRHSWDYFIFPIGFMYDADLENGRAQDMLHRGESRISWRRERIDEHLRETFGEYSKSPWISSEATKARMLPVVEDKVNPVTASHYEDGMRHIQTFVIDRWGRLLAPKTTPDEAISFINATVACKESWDLVPDGHLVVKYVRECFSQAPEYQVLRKPKKVTWPMYDRLILLEHQLRTQHKKLMEEQNVNHYIHFCAPTDGQTWSCQIDMPKG